MTGQPFTGRRAHVLTVILATGLARIRPHRRRLLLVAVVSARDSRRIAAPGPLGRPEAGRLRQGADEVHDRSRWPTTSSTRSAAPCHQAGIVDIGAEDRGRLGEDPRRRRVAGGRQLPAEGSSAVCAARRREQQHRARRRRTVAGAITAKVERDPVEWNARIEALRNAALSVLEIVTEEGRRRAVGRGRGSRRRPARPAIAATGIRARTRQFYQTLRNRLGRDSATGARRRRRRARAEQAGDPT